MEKKESTISWLNSIRGNNHSGVVGAETEYTAQALNLWAKVSSSSEIYYFAGDWKSLDPSAIKVDNNTIARNTSNELEVKDSGLSVDKLNTQAISTGIASPGVDTKLTTEKAVRTELDKKIDTAGSGLTIEDTTIKHTNSITAQTDQKLGTIAYDTEGHITGFTEKAVVDDLTTTTTDVPLSANMGKKLADEKEDVSNKVTAWQTTPDDTHYPSEKMIKDYLDAKFAEYLQLNGGTMTGDITMGTNGVSLGGQKLTGDGANLTYNSKTIELQSNKTTTISSSSTDIEYPTAKSVYTATYGNIVDDTTTGGTTNTLSAEQGKVLKETFNSYLPLAGGAMTGQITLNSGEGVCVRGSKDDSFVQILGGTSKTSGAFIHLFGKDYANGKFSLRACNGTDTISLDGTADKGLIWNNNDISGNLSEGSLTLATGLSSQGTNKWYKIGRVVTVTFFAKTTAAIAANTVIFIGAPNGVGKNYLTFLDWYQHLLYTSATETGTAQGIKNSSALSSGTVVRGSFTYLCNE